MTTASSYLLRIGEPFAAGLLELDGESPARVFCRGYRRFYECCPISYHTGAPLFPNGVIGIPDTAVTTNYFTQYSVQWDQLEAKSGEAAGIMRAFAEKYHYAGGWNHSVLNYRRILNDGVNRYEERVRNMKNDDIRESLLDVLAGIRAYHARALSVLPSLGAPERLVTALRKVPFEKAETAYEALVSINFMLSLDVWDNAGRLDSYLAKYHRGEDLTEELRCLMLSMQENGMWSVALGPDYNDITYQVLRASRGLGRPMVQLRVTGDMPEELWNLAIERILEGGGQPSFYNERVIQKRLHERLPNAPDEDILEFTGAGCTETCLEGLTFCGGIDINLNVLKLLETHMKEELASSGDFHTFYERFQKRVRCAQDDVVRELNRMYNERAAKCFAPIRTLFTEDCIENERGFFQGGARYTYAVPSDSGIPNVIDSLLAIRKLVFEDRVYTADSLLSALESNDSELMARLSACPCYGVADPAADDLVQDFTERFYKYYRDQVLDLGDGIFPTAHQFIRHVDEGKLVGRMPDGRAPFDPVADSIAPVNGKAVQGPTRMLLSAAKYHQEYIYSIPVLNLSVTKRYSPELLRGLVEGYFALDGTQIQITAVSKEKLLAAKSEPEKHKDLIVRVGGFSDYFWKLSNELQDAVVARTMYES